MVLREKINREGRLYLPVLPAPMIVDLEVPAGVSQLAIERMYVYLNQFRHGTDMYLHANEVWTDLDMKIEGTPTFGVSGRQEAPLLHLTVPKGTPIL